MEYWVYSCSMIPTFQHSNIPTFHVGGIKPVPLKIALFQHIIVTSETFDYIPAKTLVKNSTNGQIILPRMDTPVARPNMINPMRINGP